MRLIGLGDDQQSARLAVEAMHQTRARFAPHGTQGRESGKQPVHQCTRPMTRRWMYDEPCRLVDDGQVLIFVNDVERHVWVGNNFTLLWWEQLPFHGFTAAEPVIRIAMTAIDRHQTIIDQLLDAAAAEAIGGVSEPTIQSLSRGLD